MPVIRDWYQYTGGEQGVPVDGSDTQSLNRRVAQIFQDSMARHNSNRLKALEGLRQEVSCDRRFDQYDPERLAERANEVLESGRSFDWNDPYLKRGGKPRFDPLIGRSGKL